MNTPPSHRSNGRRERLLEVFLQKCLPPPCSSTKITRGYGDHSPLTRRSKREAMRVAEAKEVSREGDNGGSLEGEEGVCQGCVRGGRGSSCSSAATLGAAAGAQQPPQPPAAPPAVGRGAAGSTQQQQRQNKAIAQYRTATRLPDIELPRGAPLSRRRPCPRRACCRYRAFLLVTGCRYRQRIECT